MLQIEKNLENANKVSVTKEDAGKSGECSGENVVLLGCSKKKLMSKIQFRQ